MATRAIEHMWTYLSGCTEGIIFPNHTVAQRAVKQLSSCRTHHGTHHFAVTGEGLHVAMSPTGLECIRDAKII